MERVVRNLLSWKHELWITIVLLSIAVVCRSWAVPVGMHSIFAFFNEAAPFFTFIGVGTGIAVYHSNRRQLAEAGRSRLNNIQASLANEIMLNIDQLFTDKPENPLQFFAANQLRREFSHEIRDPEIWNALQRFIARLEYYDVYVRTKYYGGLDPDGTLNRQIDLQCDVIKYFGDKVPPITAGTHKHQRREELIEIKKERNEEWKLKVKQQTKHLFEG